MLEHLQGLQDASRLHHHLHLLQDACRASRLHYLSSPFQALQPLKPFEALCRVQGCIICICCIIFKASSSESPARVHLLSCCICFICFICFIFFLVSCRLAGLAPASRLLHLHLLSCIIICNAASASAFLQALAPCFKGATVSSSSFLHHHHLHLLQGFICFPGCIFFQR